MHIPDNYLSPASCAVLAVAAAPVIVLSVKKVKVQLKENKELAPMLGIAASLSFLLMMFNVPVPGGTTAHAVGGTLLAILIGPYAASLALTVALLLQAFLFGDGGILALGANIFNMAIVMPFVGYAIYSLFRKHHQETLGVIVGSYLSINAAAFLAGVELGLQPLIASEAGQPLYNPYGLSITVPAMLGAHLLVAGWVEAFFTFVIYRFVKQVAPTELYTPSSVLSPLGLLADGTAFGEWSAEELGSLLHGKVPTGIKNGFSFDALFSDYTIPGTKIAIGYILSAVTAVLIFYIISKIIRSMNGEKTSHA